MLIKSLCDEPAVEHVSSIEKHIPLSCVDCSFLFAAHVSANAKMPVVKLSIFRSRDIWKSGSEERGRYYARDNNEFRKARCRARYSLLLIYRDGEAA